MATRRPKPTDPISPTGNLYSRQVRSWTDRHQTYRDPNPELNRSDLFGSDTKPGLYFQIRHTDPIVSPILDERYSVLVDLPWRIESESYETQVQVTHLLGTQPYSLEDLISSAYDDYVTYGFSLWEVIYSEGRLRWLRIDPSWVNEFEVSDLYDLESVVVRGKRISPDNLWYVGHGPQDGNYWGMSELRCVVGDYLGNRQDEQIYLRSKANSAGTLFIEEQESSVSTVSQQSAEVAIEALEHYSRTGHMPSMYLPPGQRVNYVALDSPPTDHVNQSTYRDQRIRSAIGDRLGNLGLSSGSYALGETLQVEDDRRLRRALKSYLSLLNTSLPVVLGRYLDLADWHITLGPTGSGEPTSL